MVYNRLESNLFPIFILATYLCLLWYAGLLNYGEGAAYDAIENIYRSAIVLTAYLFVIFLCKGYKLVFFIIRVLLFPYRTWLICGEYLEKKKRLAIFEGIVRDNPVIIENSYRFVGKININKRALPGLKDSKIGGKPYWPVGQEYPFVQVRVEDGYTKCPLLMIAQINCQDVPADLNWPKKGIVQFFIFPDLDGGDWGFHRLSPELLCKDWKDGFRVVYHQDTDLPSYDLEFYSHPSKIPPEWEQIEMERDWSLFANPFKPLKIEIELGRVLPDPFLSYLDPELAALIDGNKEAYWEYYQRERKKLFGKKAKHQIGGFPDFYSHDPRDYQQAKGEYSNLLLLIDMDDENGIMYIRPGHFFTSFERLRNKNFTDVLYIYMVELNLT